MSSFHKIKIKDIRKETADCVSIAFDIPDNLKQEFAYKQGQYITLRLNINGEELRRSYSACSSPKTDSDLRIAIKAVENGRVSTYLNNGISVGDELDVMKPMGNFYTEMPAEGPKHYVGFAAGSGITPVLSLLKTALATHPENKFSLFYGNRSTNQIIFKDELDRLVLENQGRLKVHHILSREKSSDPLFEGRISPEKCDAIMSRFNDIKLADEFFLCGPFEMIMGLQKRLAEVGVPKERIHYELFTTEAPKESEAKASETKKGETKVTIVLDGEETVITVSGNTSILDAALDAGLDAPYACTGGSCCTCRAKVMSGSAEMDVNYALTDKEVEEGYILTCQSHPTSPEMVVDYDEP